MKRRVNCRQFRIIDSMGVFNDGGGLCLWKDLGQAKARNNSEAITSFRTLPAPTGGSWSASPIKRT